MLLEYCLEFESLLGRSLSSESLEQARLLLRRHSPPMQVRAEVVAAIASSELFARCLEQGRDQPLPSGATVGVIEDVPALAENEYSRLVAKGQDLFEHCLAQHSKVCITGFVDYELKKKVPPLLALLELLGWMVEQRIEIAELVPGGAVKAAESIAWAECMIDEYVSILHGLSQADAEKLAAEKQP
jgi:hypothetical protein